MTRKRVRDDVRSYRVCRRADVPLEARAQTGSSAVGCGVGCGQLQQHDHGYGFHAVSGHVRLATPSATDAAALGMTAPQGGMMGMGGSNNLFMNPMAVAFSVRQHVSDDASNRRA